MRNIVFITHSGISRPVPVGTYVIYRTVTEGHYDIGVLKYSNIIHLPMLAENIDWSEKPVLGRIYDYAIVNKPKSFGNWISSRGRKAPARGRAINNGSKNRKQHA